MNQRVKDEIIAAFANVPQPTTLAVEFGDRHKDSIVPLQNLLGKDWKELDSKFLDENWDALSVLTAEAYQYYLPALLICSLDSTPDSPIFYHTLNRLSPNSWYVLYEGREEWFDYQTSLLNSEQLHAICSFLGGVFDEPYGYKFGRIEYQRWGGDFPEHPASIKIKDYYQHLHNFHYPPAITPSNQELIDLIRSAFENTPRPTSKREGDRKGDPEGPDVTLAFRGLDWRTLHPDFVNLHDTALSFFTDEEFRYFIPAHLILDVWEADEFDNEQEPFSKVISNSNLLFHLTYGLEEIVTQEEIDTFNEIKVSGLWPRELYLKSGYDMPKWYDKIYRYQRAAQRLSGFSQDERKAIIAFLQFKASDNEYSWSNSNDEINNALENYWSKTV